MPSVEQLFPPVIKLSSEHQLIIPLWYKGRNVKKKEDIMWFKFQHKHIIKRRRWPQIQTSPLLDPLGSSMRIWSEWWGGNYDFLEVLLLLALHFPLRAKGEAFNSLTSGIHLCWLSPNKTSDQNVSMASLLLTFMSPFEAGNSRQGGKKWSRRG